jgi:hypothetical protein
MSRDRTRGQEFPRLTAGQVLRDAFKSPRCWGALILTLMVVSIVPTAAKTPVAMALAALLVAPAMRMAQPPVGSPLAVPIDPREGVNFDGFRGVQAGSRVRWQQVRCRIEGSELRMVSFWHKRRAPEVVSVRGAALLSIRMSEPRDLNLKPRRMSILDLRLFDGSSLQLAVDASLQHQVRSLLTSGE